ncbi:MAG TPA: pullulanase-associated domain-containing protein, partial [Actinoplanes sp.]
MTSIDPSSAPPWLIVHYAAGSGSGVLHVWGDIAPGQATPYPGGLPFAGVDEYGRFVSVRLAEGARDVGFLVVDRAGVKDVEADRHIDPTVTPEIWLRPGDPAISTEPPGPAAAPGSPGPELDPARAFAVFVDRTTIALPAHIAVRAAAFIMVASAGGELRRAGGELTGEHTALPLTPRPGGLFQAQTRKFPHLRAYRAFSVRELGDARLGDLLRGQVLVAGRDIAGRLAVLTGVQLPGVLDDLYAEAVDAELGPVVADDRPQLSVWAPTAHTVELELVREPGDEPTVLPMERDAVSGIWSIAGKRQWLGRYYRFRVEVWHPAAQRVVTSSVTDPYSVALAVDSTHSL